MRSRKLFETRELVIEVLKKLAREINATIYLFGSYARGEHAFESDVDIIVVCDCFENMDYPDRVKFIRMKLPRELGFDIIALTPKEFRDRVNKAFYREVSKNWIEISP